MRRINTLFFMAVAFFVPAIAMAAPAEGSTMTTVDGVFALAMGLGMGLAALGCGMGQGRAAAAALEGIARNPNSAEKVNTPMLLGLAFIESLTIFTFVVAFLIYGKMTA
jgi:F-type H+-transporting ATPase subunit c